MGSGGGWYVGVDIGGTFTDVVAISIETGEAVELKVESSRDAPAAAFVRGLRTLAQERGVTPSSTELVVHGTTLVTNAIIARTRAKTALVTTAGFRDVMAIGRHFRSELYDLQIRQREPLVPHGLRLEVRERIDSAGREVQAIDLEDVDTAAELLRRAEVQAVAIVFLHSYRNPDHEVVAAKRLRKLGRGWAISASHEVSREVREFERTATTVLNASLMPLIDTYLTKLEHGLANLDSPSALFVTQSNGGALTPTAARARPVNLALSGPVGGVVAADELGRRAGLSKMISLDMGGTSADVSVITEDGARFTSEIDIGGVPVRLPSIEVRAIGAGGGSIACVEPDGSLRVGPESAESDPGPACYGRGGTRPTVTDCQLLLGRLSADVSLGGRLRLDAPAAATALDQEVAAKLGYSVDEAAAGVIDVANAAMERAIRVALRDRGDDARGFAIVAFGGAGPLHAAELAARLDVQTVVVPRRAGTLSALGLLSTDVRLDFAMSRLLRCTDSGVADAMQESFADLEGQARSALEMDRSIPSVDSATLWRSCEMRYAGQAHELNVPIADGEINSVTVERAADAFHIAHERNFGFSERRDAWEIVTFRVFASVPLQRPTESKSTGRKPTGQPTGNRRIYCGRAGWVEADTYDRERLFPGFSCWGPVIVHERDTTTFVPIGFEASVDKYDNLVLSSS